MTEGCCCEGPGLGELTTPDLIMLVTTLKRVKTDEAKGMRIAIREELAKRGVKNV